MTAADDDTIRLWNPDGHKLQQFTYTGGSVQSIYVDNTNRCAGQGGVYTSCQLGNRPGVSGV